MTEPVQTRHWTPADLLLRAAHEEPPEIPVADGGAVEEAGGADRSHQDL